MDNWGSFRSLSHHKRCGCSEFICYANLCDAQCKPKKIWFGSKLFIAPAKLCVALVASTLSSTINVGSSERPTIVGESSSTVTVIVLSLIGGLRSFDLIWAMTRGGPGFTSDVMASVVYKQYQAGFYGLSTAGNVVLFVLVAIIIVPLFRFLNRREASE